MLQNSGYKYLLILCFSFSALLITGCQGCRDDSEKTAEEKKKEEEERKEDEKPSFETEDAVFYPGQYDNVIRRNLTKRGHWVTADFRITANKFDAQGEMTATSSTPVSVVPVEYTDYYSVSKRPFSISKGESKILSTSVFLPRRSKGINENVNFTMSRSAGGLPLVNELHGVRLMRSFQYHMIALTNRPDAYGYLNVIDSVMLPDEMASRAPKFFTVVRTNPREDPISLPRDALNWTTISYLIWDDLAVDQLDEDQQQALVDWLYYGGQLIMSGPDCLDKMAGTFLEPHLPAKFAGTKNLVAKDFEEVNKHWAVKVENQELRREIVVNEKMPILGVEFDLHPDAKPVTHTGKIAVERQVGRGRIVVTAFSLDDKPIIRWPSFKSFFNGALLRRPGREFGVTRAELPTFGWIGDKTSIFDPLIGSNLRYLSRDLVNPFKNSKAGTPDDAKILTDEISGFANMQIQQNTNFRFGNEIWQEERYRLKHAGNLELRNLDDHRRYGGFHHDQQSGVAGWSDTSGISAAARNSLKNAAGITPPNSDFVLRMLAVYLFVLVPVNWFIFWMIGRVEWAWIAAPLIAIGGAFTVAKLASLDIGFVRSNTQVACLEVYSDYPRAHVAQYSALYTSLSTGYDLELDNPTAQSLPLGDPDRRWEEATLSPVTLRRTLNRRLEGFQVQSNSTGMLHTEMMYDLGGVFSYRLTGDGPVDAKGEVLNATGLELGLAAVVRRTVDGQLQGAWIGDLPAESQSELIQFKPIQSVYDPWASTSFLKKDPIAEQWSKLQGNSVVDDNGESVLPLGKVVEVLPELQTRWEEFQQIAASHYSVSNTEELLQSNLSYSIFSRVMKDLNREDSVTVRQIFQVIADNLAVAPGETRLIAVTKQSLGKNVFEPASTQTQQQTLVVVHLKRPEFEDAVPDVNCLEDFTGAVSNLDGDWDSDWDEGGEDQTGEESDSEGGESRDGDSSETKDDEKEEGKEEGND